MRFSEVLKAKMDAEVFEAHGVERLHSCFSPSVGAIPTSSIPYLFTGGNIGPVGFRKVGIQEAYPVSARTSGVRKEEAHVPAAEPAILVSELSKSEKDALQILILMGACGLTEQFTRSGLKREYRKLVKLTHPDRFHSQGAAAMIEASQRFLKLQAAKTDLTRLLS